MNLDKSSTQSISKDFELFTINPIKPNTNLLNSSPLPPVYEARSASSSLQLASSIALPKQMILSSVVGGGLSVESTFVRRPSMYGESFNIVQLFLKNLSDKPIHLIKIGKMTLEKGMELIPFAEINVLAPSASVETTLHIKFTTASQPASFEIWHDDRNYPVKILPSAGELIRPFSLTNEEFLSKQKKLSGMNENEVSFTLGNVSAQLNLLTQKVLECANLAVINHTSTNPEVTVLKFSGQTLSGNLPILVTVEVNVESGKGKCKVNSESTILGSTLLTNLKKAILG